MKVSLSVVLVDHTGLLQQVVDDVASHGGTLPTGQRPGRGTGCGRGGVGKAGVLRRCCRVYITCRLDRGFVVHNKFCVPTKEIWGGGVMGLIILKKIKFWFDIFDTKTHSCGRKSIFALLIIPCRTTEPGFPFLSLFFNRLRL